MSHSHESCRIGVAGKKVHIEQRGEHALESGHRDVEEQKDSIGAFTHQAWVIFNYAIVKDQRYLFGYLIVLPTKKEVAQIEGKI